MKRTDILRPARCWTVVVYVLAAGIASAAETSCIVSGSTNRVCVSWHQIDVSTPFETCRTLASFHAAQPLEARSSTDSWGAGMKLRSDGPQGCIMFIR